MKVKVCDKNFVPYISEKEIAEAVKAVADKINSDYEGREPIFLSVLNGAFMFTSDLMKLIKVDCSLSFVKLASYCGEKSTGKVKQLMGLNVDLKGKDVIIIEDIVDSGVTINELDKIIREMNPTSVGVATFIFKPHCYKGHVKVNYSGIDMNDNNFIVGYGLDYNQIGRNLPEIYIAEK